MGRRKIKKEYGKSHILYKHLIKIIKNIIINIIVKTSK